MSIVNKHLPYLREFCEGLKLFNVYVIIKDNTSLCNDLFVQNTSGPVDSDYVFLLVSPYNSAERTATRKLRRQSWTIFKISYQLGNIRTSRATQKHWLEKEEQRYT